MVMILMIIVNNSFDNYNDNQLVVTHFVKVGSSSQATMLVSFKLVSLFPDLSSICVAWTWYPDQARDDCFFFDSDEREPESCERWTYPKELLWNQVGSQISEKIFGDQWSWLHQTFTICHTGLGPWSYYNALVTHKNLVLITLIRAQDQMENFHFQLFFQL